MIEFWHDDPARWIVAPSLKSWLGDYVNFLEAELEESDEQQLPDQLDWAPAIPGYPRKYAAQKS